MIGSKYLYAVLCLFVMFSCKDDNEPLGVDQQKLAINVQPVYGTNNLVLDEVYQTQEGYDVKFTDIKFYFGDLRNGMNRFADAGLFDYRAKGTLMAVSYDRPENYSSIFMGLGIDSNVNHMDPSGFDNSSALNIANANDMHWGWNPGYIFVKVEAKVDTIADGNALFDHLVVFHIGTDANYHPMSFSNVNWHNLALDMYSFDLKLDMEKFLANGSQSIDLKTEYTSHSMPGQEVLSDKVITNFRDAISTF